MLPVIIKLRQPYTLPHAKIDGEAPVADAVLLCDGEALVGAGTDWNGILARRKLAQGLADAVSAISPNPQAMRLRAVVGVNVDDPSKEGPLRAMIVYLPDPEDAVAIDQVPNAALRVASTWQTATNEPCAPISYMPEHCENAKVLAQSLRDRAGNPNSIILPTVQLTREVEDVLNSFEGCLQMPAANSQLRRENGGP